MQQRAHAGDGDGAPGGRAWLLVLLALALAPRAFDDIIAGHLAAAIHGTPRIWFSLAVAGAQILALVAAGIALDRFGIRKTIGVALFAWTTLTAASAALPASPLAPHAISHAANVLVGLFFGLGLCVATKPAFAMGRRGLALAVLNLAAGVWLILVPTVAAGFGWPSPPPTRFPQPAWAQGCLAASGLAAGLAILWWLTFRRRDGRAAEALVLDDRRHGQESFGGATLAEAAALFRRPGIWALVVTSACHMLVFAVLYRVLAAYAVRERLEASGVFVQSVILPMALWVVAQVVLAIWSDARARQTGDASAARVPFITVGAALSSTIGLLPLVGHAYFSAIYVAVALGMAAFPLSATFGFDIIPKALTGRFFGMAWALGLAVNTAVFFAAVLFGPRYSMAAYFYLAGLAALAAAILAFTQLRKLVPIEDSPSFVATVGKVFA